MFSKIYFKKFHKIIDNFYEKLDTIYFLCYITIAQYKE